MNLISQTIRFMAGLLPAGILLSFVEAYLYGSDYGKDIWSLQRKFELNCYGVAFFCLIASFGWFFWGLIRQIASVNGIRPIYGHFPFLCGIFFIMVLPRVPDYFPTSVPGLWIWILGSPILFFELSQWSAGRSIRKMMRRRMKMDLAS